MSIQEFRVRENGQLKDRGEQEASAPDQVLEQLDEEYPRPFFEREERIIHADVESN